MLCQPFTQHVVQALWRISTRCFYISRIFCQHDKTAKGRAMLTCKAIKLVINKSTAELACSVCTEVHKNQRIAILHLHWLVVSGHNSGCFNKLDRKSTRLNSSHVKSSYAVFCLKKKIEDLVDKGNTC